MIGRFPGETSCLTLAWAVMDLVIAGARGLAVSGPERGAIAALANVVMCRPPGNRPPARNENKCCSTFLGDQIALVKPRAILALPRPATCSDRGA